MTPKLVVISGPAEGSTFSVSPSEIAIGREPSNDISIADRLLSRRHCRINQTADAITITDLESANGTFVNGLPVKERRLAHGDVIKLGDTQLLFLCHPTDADGEAIASSGGVSFDEGQIAAQSVVTLRREESRYLNAEWMLTASPVTSRVAREFQTLLQIGLEINSLRGVEALQRRLLELISAAAPAERGAILLLDEGQGEFVSAFGWERAAAPGNDVNVSRTVVRRVIGEGVAILCNEVQGGAEFQQSPSLLYSGVQSIIAAPLASAGRVFGVVYLDTSDASAGFDEAHLQLVTAIANLSAPAFDNLRQIEQLRVEVERLRSELYFDRQMIGESERMERIRDFIARVAPSNSTVLIRGESGTGKEVAARAIHLNSPRAGKPFVAINCANLTDTLLESELFGHEKGAFTGAITQKKGKLELADGGTVFLDEIGELAPALQARLLRALQEREIERVGGTRPIKLDIRLLAATNKDLEAAINAGTFRADLFYRLNVFALAMPALRERPEDIPLLARYFAVKLGERCGRQVAVSAAACERLLRYDWPGNVRELENAIERAVVMGTTPFILPDDLPDDVLQAEAPPPDSAPTAPAQRAAPTEPIVIGPTVEYHQAVKEAKKQIVIAAIEQAGGNYVEAARRLGLHPNNLYRLIRNLNLKPKLKTLPRV